jgi:hypothetical protein
VTGIGVILVGLLLCFAGLRRSTWRCSPPASRSADWWPRRWAARPAPRRSSVSGAAEVAWARATLVFRAALVVVGAACGAVIGAKVFGLLEHDDGNVVLAVLFVLAVALLAGLAAQRFQVPGTAAAAQARS